MKLGVKNCTPSVVTCGQQQPVNYESFNLADHPSLISQKSSIQRANALDKKAKLVVSRKKLWIEELC